MIYLLLEFSQLSQETTLRFYWRDHRVNATLPSGGGPLGYVLRTRAAGRGEGGGVEDDLWYPDVYVNHAKELRRPAIFSAPGFLRIYPDGHIIYSALANYDVSCPTDFRDYPVDTQV